MCPRGRAKFKKWTAITIARKLAQEAEDEAEKQGMKLAPFVSAILTAYLNDHKLPEGADC